jgi:uncharacterized lipoprotein YmbA
MPRMPPRRRRSRLGTLCLSTLLVAACASPPARYYTLTTAAQPSSRSNVSTGLSVSTISSAAPPATSTLAIAVGPVTVPALVDRPQIVVSSGGNEVRLDEYRRWASPLQDNIARVVADDLVTLLATPRVAVLAPSGAADARYRVTIDVHSFVSHPGVSARLDATWSVRRVADDASRSDRTTARVAVTDASYDALAGAHSSALAQISAAIAAAIGELEQTGR